MEMGFVPLCTRIAIGFYVDWPGCRRSQNSFVKLTIPDIRRAHPACSFIGLSAKVRCRSRDVRATFCAVGETHSCWTNWVVSSLESGNTLRFKKMVKITIISQYLLYKLADSWMNVGLYNFVMGFLVLTVATSMWEWHSMGMGDL